MKPHFHDLTPEQQAVFGNGCSWVPDFIFTANCRQHDFNYTRGGYLKSKFKADWDMCRCMWTDSRTWWHYLITVIYFVGLTVLPLPYVAFRWGRWRTLQEIVDYDNRQKFWDGIIE